MSKIQELYKQAKDKANEAKALAMGEVFDEATQVKSDGLLAESQRLRNQANTLKASQAIIDEAGQVVMPAALPMGAEGDLPPGGADELKAALNAIRYGEEDPLMAKAMTEIYGGDYRQKMWDQDRAFAGYLRTNRFDPILRKQFWPTDAVKSMLREGLMVAEIKATMIEGQDTLGGAAVPPQRAAGILARLPGLTAVRGGGALVVDTASNMIEWLKLTGGGSQYPTAMRGLWGTEVQSPTADDFTVGLEQIPVHTYTYKVPFSQSLIEDASNLLDIFFNLVTDTLAIDEDAAFLVGDGAGKPRGILPSSTNADSLAEKSSGVADALEISTVKGLRRQVASQYRAPGRASWIGESATAEVIECWQDGIGRFYFEYLDEGERFLRSPWRESESMPTIAANAYPLIFGDLSGYAIVQRLGLSVVRFQDSNTGINKVEFHIRRRIGGKVVEPWKLAVAKCAE